MEAPQIFLNFPYNPNAICECKTPIKNVTTKKEVEENCKCKRNPPKTKE